MICHFNSATLLKPSILLLFLLFLTANLSGQEIYGIATKWSDDFSEWELLTRDDQVIGELKLRWPQRGDWSEWDYRIGDRTGQIKRKWLNDSNEWEIRADNAIISARTVWKDDFREWRITDNRMQMTIKTRYGNVADEWELKVRSYGRFEIISRWEGDPREWEVIDELDADISLPVKIALIFVSIYNSFPKS